MTVWDPGSYLTFSTERSRPFVELASRIQADAPETVVDLGCGPGELTVGLSGRWPAADVLGLDSSPEMIDRAAAYRTDRVEFRLGDIATWHPERPVDVLISNAALQWVPGHRALLPRLLAGVAAGGWLAFQVPGNFGEPSHRLLYELARDDRFARYVEGRERPAAFDPGDYLTDLAGLGCRVDAWETTYLHVLEGPDPVFRWISGTGARPVLQALPPELRAPFEDEYRALLRAAYPTHPYGTVLPFRRVFVVAQRAFR